MKVNYYNITIYSISLATVFFYFYFYFFKSNSMRKRSTKYYRNSNINFDIAYLSPTGQTCTWAVQTCFPRTNLSPSRMLSQWPISSSWILSRPTHRHRILLQPIHGLLHLPLQWTKLILVVQFLKRLVKQDLG